MLTILNTSYKLFEHTHFENALVPMCCKFVGFSGVVNNYVLHFYYEYISFSLGLESNNESAIL